MNKEWEIAPEIRILIQEIKEQREKVKLVRLEQSNQLGLEVEGKLVGFCGHLTGPGVIIYPVFQQEDGKHFIIVGSSEDDQVHLFGDEKRGIRYIKFIDPNDVFGRKMQTVTEWSK